MTEPKTELEALELIVDKLKGLKIKAEFELSIARQATNYQRASFKKSQIRYKIYTDLYKYVKGLYSGLK